jgi:hypothetical protein
MLRQKLECDARTIKEHAVYGELQVTVSKQVSYPSLKGDGVTQWSTCWLHSTARHASDLSGYDSTIP